LAFRAPGLARKARSLVVASLFALRARQGSLAHEALGPKCKVRSLACKPPSPTPGIRSLAFGWPALARAAGPLQLVGKSLATMTRGGRIARFPEGSSANAA